MNIFERLWKWIRSLFSHDDPQPQPDPVPDNALPDPTKYDYIPGAPVRDKGAEVWKLFNGMDVRLSANDTVNLRRNGVPAKGVWYPLDPDVAASAVTLATGPDGGIIATGADFISTRTGLRYHFCGFLVQVSTGTLRQVQTIAIPKADCHKTLRIMFATIK